MQRLVFHLPHETIRARFADLIQRLEALSHQSVVGHRVQDPLTVDTLETTDDQVIVEILLSRGAQ